MGNPKAEIQSAPGGLVLTREELAAALRVSLRTVDRMVSAEDIPVMELGEDLVRFYLPDVLAALRSGKVKFGRRAEGTTERNIQHSTSNIQWAESHEEAQAAQDARSRTHEGTQMDAEGGPHGPVEVTKKHTNPTKEITETTTTGQQNQ